MLCYKDRTYCDFYMECKHGEYCDRAFTPEVRKAAEKWWGNEGAPVALFSRNPECFVDIFKRDDNEIQEDKQSKKIG